MSDTVANLLTIIRNGQMVGKESVKVPYSNFSFNVAQMLQTCGFVKKVEKSGKTGKRYLEITLLYTEAGEGKIRLMRRISRPGQRMYADYRTLRLTPGVVTIISTPKGLLTGAQAKKTKVGGEIVCEIR